MAAITVVGSGRTARHLRLVTSPAGRQQHAAVYRRRRLVAVLVLVGLVVLLARLSAAAAGAAASSPSVDRVDTAAAASSALDARSGDASSGAAASAPGAPGGVAPSTLGGAPGPSDGSPAVYVVQPGDTVWSIAARLWPEEDPRRAVDRLVRLNGGAALDVGQRLVLG